MMSSRRTSFWRTMGAVLGLSGLVACGVEPEGTTPAEEQPSEKTSELAIDRYADAVAAGGVVAVLNPDNAIGAPDGNVASFLAALDGSLTLDMGAGEEGNGPLRIHYRGLTAAALARVEFLRADLTIITTGQVNLIDLGVGAHTALVPNQNPTPYRYVRLKGGLLALYFVDAVEFTGPIAACGDGVVQTGEGCDDGGTTSGNGCSATCQVEPGYTCSGAPSVCTDVNECTNGTNQCSVNATCVNTPGSYTCTCKPGYSGNGRTCNDINECTNGTAQCSANATCSNTQGSYRCTCKPGYSGDGRTCNDVNECTNGTAQCSVNATCSNTQGSYRCTCKAGYSGDGKTCNDINECTNGTAQCSANATCSNTQGSYRCSCKPGYSGDGKTCTDINECANGTHTCTPGQRCVNRTGGFDCVPGSCPSPQVLCGTKCVDANTDEANCGCCGNTCNTGKICNSGVCGAFAPLSLDATWEKVQDADLILRAPSGEMFTYERAVTHQEALAEGDTGGEPLSGTYDVCLRTTSLQTSAPDAARAPFHLTVKRSGQKDLVLRGVLLDADAAEVCNADHPDFIRSITYP
ncbi:EGF domain-containing protein [Myxococcus stipitatus]|nr:EGF domain-containing protein [Myxococcus stipitatus]